jgi:hypothetical protein
MAFITPGTVIAGEVLTAARWNQDVVANTNALYESLRIIDFKEDTSTKTLSSTSVGGATNFFSSSISFTATGTNTYVVWFYAYRVLQSSTNGSVVSIFLVDNSGTQIAQMGEFRSSGNTLGVGTTLQTFYTPAAGTRTLNIRGTSSAGNGEVNTATGSPIRLVLAGPIIQ